MQNTAYNWQLFYIHNSNNCHFDQREFKGRRIISMKRPTGNIFSKFISTIMTKQRDLTRRAAGLCKNKSRPFYLRNYLRICKGAENRTNSLQKTIFFFSKNFTGASEGTRIRFVGGVRWNAPMGMNYGVWYGDHVFALHRDHVKICPQLLLLPVCWIFFEFGLVLKFERAHCDKGCAAIVNYRLTLYFAILTHLI